MNYDMFFAYVSGMENAKNFQVPYGRNALLMDTDKPVFYVKSLNPTGQSVIKVYEFHEITPKVEQPKEYVTTEQFNDFARKIEELLGAKKNESDISTNNEQH